MSWTADWYASQKEVHLTGSPRNRGSEILGSFTLALPLRRSPSVGPAVSVVGSPRLGASSRGESWMWRLPLLPPPVGLEGETSNSPASPWSSVLPCQQLPRSWQAARRQVAAPFCCKAARSKGGRGLRMQHPSDDPCHSNVVTERVGESRTLEVITAVTSAKKMTELFFFFFFPFFKRSTAYQVEKIEQ